MGDHATIVEGAMQLPVPGERSQVVGRGTMATSGTDSLAPVSRSSSHRVPRSSVQHGAAVMLEGTLRLQQGCSTR